MLHVVIVIYVVIATCGNMLHMGITTSDWVCLLLHVVIITFGNKLHVVIATPVRLLLYVIIVIWLFLHVGIAACGY